MVEELFGHFLGKSNPQSRNKDKQQKDKTNHGQPVKPDTVFAAQGAKDVI